MRPITKDNLFQFIKNLPRIWWEDLKTSLHSLKIMGKETFKISVLFTYVTVLLIVSVVMWKKWLVLTFFILYVILYFWKKYDSGKDIELEKRKINL